MSKPLAYIYAIRKTCAISAGVEFVVFLVNMGFACAQEYRELRGGFGHKNDRSVLVIYRILFELHRLVNCHFLVKLICRVNYDLVVDKDTLIENQIDLIHRCIVCISVECSMIIIGKFKSIHYTNNNHL